MKGAKKAVETRIAELPSPLRRGSASPEIKRVIGTLMITPHKKKNSISLESGL